MSDLLAPLLLAFHLIKLSGFGGKNVRQPKVLTKLHGKKERHSQSHLVLLQVEQIEAGRLGCMVPEVLLNTQHTYNELEHSNYYPTMYCTD